MFSLGGVKEFLTPFDCIHDVTGTNWWILVIPVCGNMTTCLE